MDLRVTARRPVLLTNSASIVVGFARYAQSLILPQILQLPEETGHGLGRSMIMMGLCMAPGGLMMMAVSPIGGKLSAGHGPKTTLLVGCLIIALGYTAGLLLMGSVLGLAVVATICRTGVGFAYGAMPALIIPTESGFRVVLLTGAGVALLAAVLTVAGPQSRRARLAKVAAGATPSVRV